MSKRAPVRRSRKAAPRQRKAAQRHRQGIAISDSSPLDLKLHFESGLKHRRPIVVDAQAAGPLSAAQMQVLVAAAVSAKSAGVPFRIAAASDSFLASVEDLGLGGWLREHRGDLTESG